MQMVFTILLAGLAFGGMAMRDMPPIRPARLALRRAFSRPGLRGGTRGGGADRGL